MVQGRIASWMAPLLCWERMWQLRSAIALAINLPETAKLWLGLMKYRQKLLAAWVLLRSNTADVMRWCMVHVVVIALFSQCFCYSTAIACAMLSFKLGSDNQPCNLKADMLCHALMIGLQGSVLMIIQAVGPASLSLELGASLWSEWEQADVSTLLRYLLL